MYGGRGRGARGRGGRGRGGGGGRHSQAKSDTHFDVVTKRLLSANRLKMNELQNKLEEMRKELRVVKDENKLYKRMQHKQEKALVKFEDRESELPQLIQSHNNEIRALKEQLRRTREKYEKTDRYLRDAEDELETTKNRLKKYKSLSEQKDLAERSDLDRRLNKAELAIEEKECKIKEVERHLEMLKKNHRHELGIERARAKDLQKQLDETKENNAKLEAVLKEKEKQLEAKNIYANRFLKPNSYNGTPTESPPPWRQNLKKKSGSLQDLTPRDKAKAYEQKRKVEEKKKQERSPRKPEPKQKWEVEEREKDAAGDSPEGPSFNFNSLQREDSEADFWRRQEERYKRDQQNREKQEDDQRKRKEEEKEQTKFRQQREKLQRDMEERERAERERREADERERREREERDRRDREDRERREREDGERREREERERREREDRERREEEQRERDRKEQERKMKELDNDPHLAEERRKKDELIRRLKEMDSNRDGSQPASDPFAPSDSTRARGKGDSPLAHSPSRRAKDPFLFTRTDSSDSTPSSKKDYTFTRSIENMHKGKPAHEDVSVPYIDRQKKIKAARDDADVGGYQPSFASPTKTPNAQKKPMSLFDDDPKPASKPAASSTDKKSKLMADLFGSSSSGPKKEDGDDFFLTSKPPPGKTQSQPKKASGFPWDTSASGSAKVNGSATKESSTLFGGGAALVDDDISGSKSPKSNMLPRRSRQPASTLNSKPSVMAVDSLDDDIEEVIL